MRLELQLLGTSPFQLDHVPVTASGCVVATCLGYLAVTDHEHPGQRTSHGRLVELFWTEYDPVKGLANLRHTLWEFTQFMTHATLEWTTRSKMQAGLYVSNRLRTFWENYDLCEKARWLWMI